MVVTLQGSGNLTALHYPVEVFEEIRLTAVEKFLSIPRGGLEIGGVLFGHIDGSECRIISHRPLPIEYKVGPSFQLSGADEAALEQLLAADPTGLQPVGWYHTHTRSELALSPEDSTIHQRFFPRPAQIAVVLKPFKFEPVQGAVYVRDSQGGMSAPWATFELERPGGKLRTPEPSPAVVAATAPASIPDLVPDEGVEPKKGLPWRWIAAGAVIVSLAALWDPSAPTPEPVAQAIAIPPSKPEIRVVDSSGQLSIGWDGDAAWVREAAGGQLWIRDGSFEPAAIPVDAGFLRRGTVTYARRSGDVDVRLIVRTNRGEQSEAAARFVGAAPEPVIVERTPAKVDVEKAREVEKARTEPPRPAPARVLVASPARRTVPSAAALEPPSLQVSASGQIQLPFDSPKAASVPPMRAAPAKQSGRAIWTGSLPPGGHLLITSGRVSSGSISGKLPAKAGRMTIHPADLASSGIIVYTTQGSSNVEPPNAANGWNLTTYRKDAKKSRAVTVLEHPNAQNDFRRLLVRAEDRPVTMLVIQWEEL